MSKSAELRRQGTVIREAVHRQEWRGIVLPQGALFGEDSLGYFASVVRQGWKTGSIQVYRLPRGTTKWRETAALVHGSGEESRTARRLIIATRTQRFPLDHKSFSPEIAAIYNPILTTKQPTPYKSMHAPGGTDCGTREGVVILPAWGFLRSEGLRKRPRNPVAV